MTLRSKKPILALNSRSFAISAKNCPFEFLHTPPKNRYKNPESKKIPDFLISGFFNCYVSTFVRISSGMWLKTPNGHQPLCRYQNISPTHKHNLLSYGKCCRLIKEILKSAFAHGSRSPAYRRQRRQYQCSRWNPLWARDGGSLTIDNHQHARGL